jgi:IclR family KDG regulon transcriptional repressor
MPPHNENVLHNINTSSNNDTGSYVLATTVIKAFRLLEYIGNHQPVQPAELVHALGFSRANVHRLLATFMNMGYVVRGEKGYSLTFKLFKLGSTVPLSRDLREVAKPIMIDLMKTAQENIYLTVLVEDMVIAVDEVKSSHHLTLNPDVTYSYPVYTCASGKLFLSALSDEELEGVVNSLTMEKRAVGTITDKEQFTATVKRCRQEGFALELQEFSSDLNSVAAPIQDYRAKMVATISISGPSMRLTEERIRELIPSLRETAGRISERLGRGEEE